MGGREEMQEMMVIVNPVAANGKVGKKWPQVREFLESRGVPFSSSLTQYHQHAIHLAREAVQKGFQTIVAFGGDGTLNEVVNGVFQEGLDVDVTIGAIPGGTGSDFTRSLNLPRDPVEAFKRLLEGRTRLVDLGEIECLKEGKPERRYFINIAGMGFDAEVAERTNRAPKFLGGTIPYLFNLFIPLVTYRSKHYRIEMDGKTLEQKAYFLVIAIGKYFAGGMFVAPEAELDDGLFDVLIIGDMPKLEFVANVARVYKGTHLEHPKVDAYKARHIKVHSESEVFIQAEGEIVGTAPATFKIHPKTVKFLY
ncbi:MAG: diacylglycerol kinase family lipid kinase [Chloroflexi bacterium]|nr:MAG: diacylglycerol kinase family lipid kinase [Chloroflexota bacterium]